MSAQRLPEATTMRGSQPDPQPGGIGRKVEPEPVSIYEHFGVARP